MTCHAAAFEVSIHAPAEGATSYSDETTLIYEFQSTLPRRERPQAINKRLSRLLVSIHAPAEGATNYYRGGIRL